MSISSGGSGSGGALAPGTLALLGSSTSSLRAGLGVARLSRRASLSSGGRRAGADAEAVHVPGQEEAGEEELSRAEAAQALMLEPGHVLTEAVLDEMMGGAGGIARDAFWEFVKTRILATAAADGGEGEDARWGFLFHVARKVATTRGKSAEEGSVPMDVVRDLFFVQQPKQDDTQPDGNTLLTREQFETFMEQASANSAVSTLVSLVFARSMAITSSVLTAPTTPTPAPAPESLVPHHQQQQQQQVPLLSMTAMPTPSWTLRAGVWLTENFDGILMCGFWIACCVAVFAVFFQEVSPAVVSQMGVAAPGIARGTAQLVNFNTLLTLLFMCRRFLTRIRTLMAGIPQDMVLGHFVKSFMFYVVDHAVDAHKVTGVMVLVCALIHTLCWVYMFHVLGGAPVGFQNAVMKTNNTTPLTSAQLWCCTVPGTTGWLMCGLFAIVYPFTVRQVRRASFALFWFMHQWFVVYIILVIIHGSEDWLNEVNSAAWLAPALILYFIDVSFRVWGFVFHYNRAEVDVEHSRVRENAVELVLHKPAARKGTTTTKLAWDCYVPGAFAFMCVPEISKYEWHPFTIVSAPEEKKLEFRFQVVGRWTQSLARYLKGDSSTNTPLRVYLDGPFGAPTQSWKAEKFLVCIALGAGITPFLCILRSILANVRVHQCECGRSIWCTAHTQHKKIIVIWVARDVDTAFGWFEDGLNDICKESNGLIEVHRFITGDLKKVDHRTLIQQLAETPSAVKTYFHRPSWRAVMRSVATAASCCSTSCGVYFCGNVSVGHTIQGLVGEVNARAKERGEDFVMTLRREVF